VRAKSRLGPTAASYRVWGRQDTPGFSGRFTKVNRCITEGRRAFLTRYARIEGGDERERWLRCENAQDAASPA
jgi:hypothetical protein